MVWCKHCAKPRDTIRDPDDGFLCCTTCGKVVYQDIFSNDIVFIKGAEGQSHMAGNFVKTVQSEYSESHNRTLEKGRGHISDMVDRLCIGGGDSIVNPAFSFYKIAVERNFTRGRRTDWVAAACLYIACREQKKAYLLIDFSEHLQTNVYVIGAVFLQLCKLLRLEEHPIVQKPVDPSLFIHRFTDRLLGGQKVEVSRTALRIIASMKRDWMQTGRKPSGICGAALYISALSHGLKYSKSDVVRVVHICEATLTKRLIEFENTESGSLTIEEFNMKAEELEGEVGSYRKPNADSGLSGELLCEHKDSGKTHFAHGLCHSCFDDFIKLSGGLQGGSEPPAFQRAERERMAKASVEDKMTESTDMNSPCQNETNNKHVGREEEVNSQVLKNEGLASIDPERFDTGKPFNSDGACDKPHGSEDMDTIAGDESETFSDIDDSEVNGYLHNEEEKRYKKIIWEEMNREYLEEQAAKEAAAAAKVASEANFQGCPEDFLAAKELAAAAAAAVAKSRKDKQQKRAAEAKNGTPAQTPAEATRQMLAKKRLSSKINYDVLEKLFDDSTAPTTKKKRADIPPETDANEDLGSKTEPESDVVDNNEDLGHQDEEGYTEAAYGDESYEFEDGYYCDDDNDYV